MSPARTRRNGPGTVPPNVQNVYSTPLASGPFCSVVESSIRTLAGAVRPVGGGTAGGAMSANATSGGAFTSLRRPFCAATVPVTSASTTTVARASTTTVASTIARFIGRSSLPTSLGMPAPARYDCAHTLGNHLAGLTYAPQHLAMPEQNLVPPPLAKDDGHAMFAWLREMRDRHPVWRDANGF